ncbi:hypothetical protein [Rubrivirga sp. IMCC43871]|uniref:hypothetical protein n=1 Tax=Rubrivirga sp. IMCC43871 TaxID=3391575 RepID=UPI00398FA87F
MRLYGFLLALLTVAGCATMGPSTSTPVVSCGEAQFSDVRARTANSVDQPPEPVGGLAAVQSRVRIPNEGRRRATPEGRFVVVRAVVDTTGAVMCSDVLSSETAAKGEAAQRAIHDSAFVPGHLDGTAVVTVLGLRLDVRGEGQIRVMTGAELGI